MTRLSAAILAPHVSNCIVLSLNDHDLSIIKSYTISWAKFNSDKKTNLVRPFSFANAISAMFPRIRSYTSWGKTCWVRNFPLSICMITSLAGQMEIPLILPSSITHIKPVDRSILKVPTLCSALQSPTVCAANDGKGSRSDRPLCTTTRFRVDGTPFASRNLLARVPLSTLT